MLNVFVFERDAKDRTHLFLPPSFLNQKIGFWFTSPLTFRWYNGFEFNGSILWCYECDIDRYMSFVTVEIFGKGLFFALIIIGKVFFNNYSHPYFCCIHAFDDVCY